MGEIGGGSGAVVMVVMYRRAQHLDVWGGVSDAANPASTPLKMVNLSCAEVAVSEGFFSRKCGGGKHD